MNASSLLPPASPNTQQAVPRPAPAFLTPEQLAVKAAQRKALNEAVARDTLLRKIAGVKDSFQAGVLDIQDYLDKNPRGFTRDQVLALLTPEQRAAFATVSDWAKAGLAAFNSPAPAPAPAPEEPAPAAPAGS